MERVVHTNFPRLKGPGLKLLLPKNLAEMGILYATNCPHTAREKIAVVASEPARVRRPSNQVTIPAKITPFTGVSV
jgi:hypothetical protein